MSLSPQPHHRFDPFQQLPGVHTLDYIGHDKGFPIGFIGGGPIDAAQARTTITEAFQHKYGPIIHVSLAPHNGSLGFGHDNVVVFDELPIDHTTVVADAVIVPKTSKFTIETLLGDCSCDIVTSDTHVGFIHCGTPELFAGLLDRFRDVWPSPMGQTDIFMGPCITGRNYLYDPDQVPEKYKSFLVECDGRDTIWDEGWTFGLAEAIESQIRKWTAQSFENCGIDPFTGNRMNDAPVWGSVRYYKHMKDRHGQGDGLSPRDCALFRYEPAS